MTRCGILKNRGTKKSKNAEMKRIKRTIKNKISVQFPDFRQEKTVLGIWGRDQIKKLGFLGQEMILMKME